MASTVATGDKKTRDITSLTRNTSTETHYSYFENLFSLDKQNNAKMVGEIFLNKNFEILCDCCDSWITQQAPNEKTFNAAEPDSIPMSMPVLRR